MCLGLLCPQCKTEHFSAASGIALPFDHLFINDMAYCIALRLLSEISLISSVNASTGTLMVFSRGLMI